jgi:hypothetical protein
MRPNQHTTSRRPDDGILDATAVRLALTGNHPHVAATLTTRELHEAVRIGITLRNAEGDPIGSEELGRRLNTACRTIDRIRAELRRLPVEVNTLAAMTPDEYMARVDRHLRYPGSADIYWLAMTEPPLLDRTVRAVRRLQADLPRQLAEVSERCPGPSNADRRRWLRDNIRDRQGTYTKYAAILAVRRRELTPEPYAILSAAALPVRELVAA